MPGGRRFGKYLLHESVGLGGMGELYLATRIGASRGTPPSVLKMLLAEHTRDAEFVSMFHDEARIGMLMEHPGIIRVQDLGRVGDTPYLVLEYVHGENLRNVLRALAERREKMPLDLATLVVAEALRALHHAHTRADARGKPLNVVHRDLSPDNVMASFDGDVKVLDFGIAKAEGRRTRTGVGILKGKVQYMSPEQAMAWQLDARADVYSMGLVLLELITGAKRFDVAADPVDLVHDARSWQPTPPSDQDPRVPAELDAIVMMALESGAERRYQSAAEFAAALDGLRKSGALPRGKEILPSFLHRLFPDRAEPFLLTEEPVEDDPTLTAELLKARRAKTNRQRGPAGEGGFLQHASQAAAAAAPREDSLPPVSSPVARTVSLPEPADTAVLDDRPTKESGGTVQLPSLESDRTAVSVSMPEDPTPIGLVTGTGPRAPIGERTSLVAHEPAPRPPKPAGGARMALLTLVALPIAAAAVFLAFTPQGRALLRSAPPATDLASTPTPDLLPPLETVSSGRLSESHGDSPTPAPE